MRIEYEPVLMERTVFLAARRDPQVEKDLHAIIDPLYEIPAGRERETAFQKAYASLFARLGLSAVFERLLAERPLILWRAGRCIVRDAMRPAAQSAELFVRKSAGDPPVEENTLMIQVAAASLCSVAGVGTRDGEPAAFISFLRRELLHIADMLDPQFEYRTERFEGTPGRQNRIRDRYRLLWDVYVEGRLHREGMGEQSSVSRLRNCFERLFPGEPAGAGASHMPSFDAVSEATGLTHLQLMTWATQPEIRMVEAGVA